MLANYFWMFCEGLHLHLVLVVVFVKDVVAMRWFFVIGWVSPIVPLVFYAGFRAYSDDNTECWMNESLYMWILTVPVCISMLCSIGELLILEVKKGLKFLIKIFSIPWKLC